ncbi:MAG: phage tail tube protein [Bacillota bacterium]|nr:phage tail tube protein [Bacillota bacterium]
MPSYGFRGQIGFGEETAWGTPAATISKFMEFKSESIKRAIAEIVSPGIRLTPNELKTQRMQGRTDISGDVVMDAYLLGQGLLWKHALGAVTTQPQGATAAYLHTFTCADDLPVGLTAEIERDARAFKYSGLKVASLRIRQGDDGALELAWEFRGKDELLAASPATPTYPADNKLIGVGLTVIFTIAGVEYHPSNFEVTLTNRLDENCYGFNKTRYALPFMGREVTGTVTIDFDDQTVYDMFVNGTPAALELKYTGATIADTYKEELTITLPVVLFNGETPNIGGKDRINLVLPFRAFADGTTKPIEVKLQNTETAI